ncbi:hypothetical protein IHE44_0001343 [Lamprotornis superbus]|uniref:Uncharacterized protein n=1 Tax=Lamprotornis superbus TaxID=245042 RepID=A0A835TML6_9PASS|nr:hypothetical protein IHE44_0001343 [Lamprotornis superbus]
MKGLSQPLLAVHSVLLQLTGVFFFPRPLELSENSSSQRNSLEEGIRSEQRTNSMAGLSPVPFPAEPGAPVRTAKAERRHQERLRMQSPELLSAQDKDRDRDKELSPAERRALEAEKRAMWRAARMKSLEQDALKAQMVIAKSKEGKKRSTLEQLAESPSPAPTPSPTPLEDCSPRNVTSPGRLSPDAADDLRYVDDRNSSGWAARGRGHTGNTGSISSSSLSPGGHGPVQQQEEAPAQPAQSGDRCPHIALWPTDSSEAVNRPRFSPNSALGHIPKLGQHWTDCWQMERKGGQDISCQKASPPTSCTVSPHFPLGVFGNGKLGGKKKKKKRKKSHQNSSKVPPSATGTLCSRKTEPALPPASVLVGHCSCQGFVLSWGQVPPWMATSPFVTHDVSHEHTSGGV